MRNQFFRTLSAWCFKSTLSTYEPTMVMCRTSLSADVFIIRPYNVTGLNKKYLLSVQLMTQTNLWALP